MQRYRRRTYVTGLCIGGIGDLIVLVSTVHSQRPGGRSLSALPVRVARAAATLPQQTSDCPHYFPNTLGPDHLMPEHIKHKVCRPSYVETRGVQIEVDSLALNARRFNVDISQSIRPVDSSTSSVRSLYDKACPW